MRGKRKDKQVAWAELSAFVERQIGIARAIRDDISLKEVERRGEVLRERVQMLKDGGRIDAKQVHRIRKVLGALLLVLGHQEGATEGPERPPAGENRL